MTTPTVGQRLRAMVRNDWPHTCPNCGTRFLALKKQLYCCLPCGRHAAYLRKKHLAMTPKPEPIPITEAERI